MRLTSIVSSCAAFACAFVATAGPSSAVAVGNHPVRVSTCNPQLNATTPAGFVPAYYPVNPYYWRDVYGARYYQRPVQTNPTLSVDYANATPVPITAIEFGLVARGTLIAEVRDVGTFSPGVEIKHQFGLNPNVFPIGTGLPRCVPLRVTFADGTKWRNPKLPALRQTL